MDEATLTRKLEASLNDSSLVLQVAFAVPYVQVVINRTQLPPDYPTLSQRIAELLGQIGIPEMQYVAVYGRVYGQEELEYETSLAIVAPAPTAPIPVSSSENPFLTAVADTSAPSEPEPFNLAKYCFTRNRALLTSDLPSPKIALAELLRDFDHFLDSEKQLILEQFSTFLRNPDGVNTANWSEEMRAWLDKVRNFGDEETRNMAIWLSRYCAHPETTLETVQGVIKAAEEAAKERARQEREARLAERQGRTTSGGRSHPTADHRQQRGSTPPRRPRSPAAKVFALLGLVVATVVSTWFFRGVTQALDVFSTIWFVIGFLFGWFGGLAKVNTIGGVDSENEFLKMIFPVYLLVGIVLAPITIITREGLTLWRRSKQVFFGHLLLGTVLSATAIISLYILSLLLDSEIVTFVVALFVGSIVGSLGCWLLESFGENDEAEGVKYGRFYGLSKTLLLWTIIAHFTGILLSGLPGLEGFEFTGTAIPDFSNEKCASIQQGMTVRELEKILNALPKTVSFSVDGRDESIWRAKFIWNYYNGQIEVVTEEIIDKSNLPPDNKYAKYGLGEYKYYEYSREAKKYFKEKGMFDPDKKIVMVPQCGVCTWERVPEGGLVRLCDTFEGFPNPSTPPNLDGSETPQ